MAEPWEIYQQQATADPEPTGAAGGGKEPWELYSQPQDQEEDTGPVDKTDLGAFGRTLIKEQAPVAGGFAGAAIGAGIGLASPIPGGALMGGIAGGLGGGYLAQYVQDKLVDALGLKDGSGWFSDKQAAEDAKHPWSRRLAEGIGTAETFAGGPASGMARIASGGINAGIETGSQAASDEDWRPMDIFLKGAEGALLPNVRGGAPQKVFNYGEQLGGRIARGIGIKGGTAPQAGRGETASKPDQTPPPPANEAGGDQAGSEQNYPKAPTEQDEIYRSLNRGLNPEPEIPHEEQIPSTARSFGDEAIPDLRDSKFDIPGEQGMQVADQHAARAAFEAANGLPKEPEGMNTGPFRDNSTLDRGIDYQPTNALGTGEDTPGGFNFNIPKDLGITRGDVAPDHMAALADHEPPTPSGLKLDAQFPKGQPGKTEPLTATVNPPPAPPVQHYDNPHLEGQKIARSADPGQQATVARMDKNGVVHVDKRLPTEMPMADGKTIDPALPLAWREAAYAEARRMQKQHPAGQAKNVVEHHTNARDIANAAMKDFLIKQGIDPNEFNSKLSAWAQKAGYKVPAPKAVDRAPTGGLQDIGNGVKDNSTTEALPQGTAPLQEVGNKPGERPTPMTTPAKPKVVSRALQKLAAAGKMDEASALANIADPKEQQAKAAYYLNLLNAKNPERVKGPPKNPRIPSAKPHAANGVEARNTAKAAIKDRALAASEKAATEAKPIRKDFNPANPEHVKELRDNLRSMVKAAQDANGGRSPHATYQIGRGRGAGAAEAPWHFRLIQQAEHFLNANNEYRTGNFPTQAARVSHFVGDAEMLRSGKTEEVKQFKKGEADTAKNKAMGEAAVDKAEADNFKKTNNLEEGETLQERQAREEREDAAAAEQTGPKTLRGGESAPTNEELHGTLNFHVEPKIDPAKTTYEELGNSRKSGEHITKMSDADLDRLNGKQEPAKPEKPPELTVQEKIAKQRALREAAEAASKKEKQTRESGVFDEAPETRPKNLIEGLRDFGGNESGAGKIPGFIKKLSDMMAKDTKEAKEAPKEEAPKAQPKAEEAAPIPPFSEVPRDAWNALFGAPTNDVVTSAISKIIDPAKVSKLADYAASLIRGKNGFSARARAIAVARLEPFRRIVNEAPEDHKLNMFLHMDDPAGNPLVDEKYRPIIDVLRPLFKEVADNLKALGYEDKVEFIKNYMPHMWKTPAMGRGEKDAVAEFFMRQGNESSLKKRDFVKMKDGIDHGFKLASDDPIEVALRYLSSMHDFTRSREILQEAFKKGYVYTQDPTTGGGASGHPNNSMLHPDSVKLEGRGLEPYQKLYAHKDFATVYNNFIDPGWKTTAFRKNVYDALQHGSNALTSLELSLSAFHVFTMAKEAMLTRMAMGMGNIGAGEFARGAKQIASAPLAPVSLYKIGRNVQDIYLKTPGSTDGMPAGSENIVNQLTGGGTRMMGRSHDPSYQYSQMPNLWQSFKNASLDKEWKQVKQSIKDAPGAFKGIEAGRQIVKGIGRALQTTSAKLFDDYIPAIKAGAQFELMGEWLHHNPDATPDQVNAMSRKIVDTIDNRFGEMVQDNIFLGNMVKQSAMVLMRSWSWNFGTVREIGGGAMSALSNPKRLSIKNGEFDPRVGYALALPVMVAAASSVYQYLKTGEGPKEARDLMVPRTGGKSARYGGPERAIMPGYEKDVYGWALNSPLDEAAAKLASAPHLVWELARNKDYRDRPIRDVRDGAGTQVMQYLQHVMDRVGPISVEQLWEGKEKGSNISLPERAAALRPAPAAMTNPRYIEGVRAKHDTRMWKMKTRSDSRNVALKKPEE